MFMMKNNLKIRSKKILFGKIHQVSTLRATSWQIHPQWNFLKLDLFWFSFKLAILGESKDWKAEFILKALLGFSTVPLASKQGAEHSLPSICTRLPKLWNMQQWHWNCFHLLALLPCRFVGLYDQGFVGLWSRCDGSGPTLPCFPCKGCRSRPTCCLVTVAFHIQLLNMSHKTNQRLSENIKVWCVERAGNMWDYSNFWNLAILIGSAASLSPYYYFEVFLILCQQLLQVKYNDQYWTSFVDWIGYQQHVPLFKKLLEAEPGSMAELRSPAALGVVHDIWSMEWVDAGNALRSLTFQSNLTTTVFQLLLGIRSFSFHHSYIFSNTMLESLHPSL